jgi:hypothetical protein
MNTALNISQDVLSPWIYEIQKGNFNYNANTSTRMFSCSFIACKLLLLNVTKL